MVNTKFPYPVHPPLEAWGQQNCFINALGWAKFFMNAWGQGIKTCYIPDYSFTLHSQMLWESGTWYMTINYLRLRKHTTPLCVLYVETMFGMKVKWMNFSHSTKRPLSTWKHFSRPLGLERHQFEPEVCSSWMSRRDKAEVPDCFSFGNTHLLISEGASCV